METKNKTEKKEDVKTAVVRGRDMGISTKHAIAICKFLKGKTIARAKLELNEVLKMKRAIPMDYEVPHRKGNITGGRYPIKAAEYFIKLLNSLEANANAKGIDLANAKIHCIANKASKPYHPGKYRGRRFKRSHVEITLK